MKNSLKNLLSGSWLSLALLAIFSLGVLSCKKEEVVLPPVISVSVSTLSGAPGAQLTATVSAEATKHKFEDPTTMFKYMEVMVIAMSMLFQ